MGVKCVVGIAGKVDHFSAPVLQDSDVPALLGIRSLKSRRAVIDCFTGRMYMMVQAGTRCSFPPAARRPNLSSHTVGTGCFPAPTGLQTARHTLRRALPSLRCHRAVAAPRHPNDKQPQLLKDAIAPSAASRLGDHGILRNRSQLNRVRPQTQRCGFLIVDHCIRQAFSQQAFDLVSALPGTS